MRLGLVIAVWAVVLALLGTFTPTDVCKLIYSVSAIVLATIQFLRLTKREK